jgi:hypothetical protein
MRIFSELIFCPLICSPDAQPLIFVPQFADQLAISAGCPDRRHYLRPVGDYLPDQFQLALAEIHSLP